MRGQNLDGRRTSEHVARSRVRESSLPKPAARLQSLTDGRRRNNGARRAQHLASSFSIVQRKALTPNDFTGLNELAERLLDFQYYSEATAKPFEWKFTKADLATLLAKLSAHEKLAA